MTEHNKNKGSVTIVLFSGDLDKAIAAFVIATAVAAMSMSVNIFFSFWGLNAIKKEGDLIKGQNWIQKIMNVMGLKKEDFIDECQDVIGAVSYLSIAKESEVNLFI